MKLRLAYAFIAVMVTLSVLSLWVVGRDANRMPEADEFAQVVEAVRANATESGDSARVLPLWFKSPRVGLDGIQLIQTSSLEQNLDFAQLDRLFVLAETWESETLDETLDHLDNIEVIASTRRYQAVVGTPALRFRAIWDAADAIRAAKVENVRRNQTREACDRWLQDAWHCGRFNQWLHVGTRYREIDDNPRRCIIANPRESHESWSIKWEDVPFGDRLRIREGLTMWALRAVRGGNVNFSVLVNGDTVHEATIEPNQYGYGYREVESREEWGERGDIEVRIATDDHFDRFFCFRLQTVEDLD